MDFAPMTQPPENSRPMTGKTCVVTGATSGLGRAAAWQLAQLGAELVLTGRNEAAGTALVARMRRECGVKAEFFRADLASLAEVNALAAAIAATHPAIDVLVNNAGARNDRYQESADGIELTFATNHLAHFLLTGRLLENLERSGAGRVITVASVAHRSVTDDPVEWVLPRGRYDRRQAYARSKLANILFAFELARRLRNRPVMSNAVDPGIVFSRFGRNNGLLPWVKHILSHTVKGEMVSADRAAESVVYSATSPEGAKTTGKLFRGRQIVEASAHAQNVALAADLWARSVKLTDIFPVFRQLG